MKVKIKSDKRTGQMSAEYFTVADKKRFRMRLLQKVLEAAQGEAVLMVDTNQRLADACTDDVLNTLRCAGLEPLVMPMAANPQRLLGISYTPKKNKASENLILVTLTDGAAPAEEALAALMPYDIALGLGPSKTPQEIGNLLITGTPIFGSGCFGQELYDSILCSVVRSSFDLTRHIKETTDEMGI